MIAQVIVDIAHTDVDKIFDYDCRSLDVKIGSRVIVPFGNKKIEGIVIGLRDQSEFSGSLKAIIRTLEDIPAITEESLALVQFMCDT